MRFPDGEPTALVFSHPNHELAIFGMVQALRPTLVFLTDGGSGERVDQTRRGLDTIGLCDHARFLAYSEQSFYEALLDGDAGFYAGVAARVREVLRDLRPKRVLCDAVEFYNPVHDMSLPVVRAALSGDRETPVFEVPLVHQTPSESETYRIQRTPDGGGGEHLEWRLSPSQLQAKIDARDAIYTILTEQMGALILDLPREHLAVEVVTPAATSLPESDGRRSLRYERRARLLLEKGEIDRAITYRDHYLPVASSLF
jgi:hypothetical protein